jgi:hypothetical protein
MMGAHDVTVTEMAAQIEQGRHLVPEHVWKGAEGYILYGKPTGSFLSAMFQNDFLETACGADDVCGARLPDLARFLYNYAPHDCWRGAEKVTSWRQHGGVAGGAHLVEWAS